MPCVDECVYACLYVVHARAKAKNARTIGT